MSDKIKLGYFDDNARMEKLDVVFANHYLQAYQNYKVENHAAIAGSWLLIQPNYGSNDIASPAGWYECSYQP